EIEIDDTCVENWLVYPPYIALSLILLPEKHAPAPSLLSITALFIFLLSITALLIFLPLPRGSSARMQQIRRICHCSPGFPRTLQTDASKDDFLYQVSTLEHFLRGPFGIRVRESSTATVRVAVPKVVPPRPRPPPPQPAAVVDAFAGASAAPAAPDGADDASIEATRLQTVPMTHLLWMDREWTALGKTKNSRERELSGESEREVQSGQNMKFQTSMCNLPNLQVMSKISISRKGRRKMYSNCPDDTTETIPTVRSTSNGHRCHLHAE
ncbi:hypothetical protein CRG98_020097, partial [Punica granatum]